MSARTPQTPTMPPKRRQAQEELRVSEERLKLALLATDTGMWEWHAADGVRHVSENWCRLLGHPAGRLDGPGLLAEGLMHSDDVAGARDRLLRHLDGSAAHYEAEYRLRTGGGEWRWVHDRGRVVERDAEGQPRRMIGMHTDVTERRAAEALLVRQRERALVTLASIADAVITTDSRGIVEYLNPVAENLTGWSLEEAQGEPLTRVCPVLHEVSREPVETSAERVLDEERPIGLTSHFLLSRRDGVEFAIDESASPLTDAQGRLTGVVMVFRDATPQRQITRQLSHEATHDGLTGLINRPEFERRLARVVVTAREAGTTHGLCYLDLDRFKTVNDSCGHGAGDSLLRQLAAALRADLRSRDTLARLGGDEFAVLLEHCELEQARRIAESLRTTVADFRFTWEGSTFGLGVSIGLVEVTADTGTEADVMRAADAACYHAKRAGRNCVHVSRSDDLSAAAERTDWAGRITRGLEQSRFRLSVQRILPLRPDASPPELWEVFLRLEDDGGVMMPAAAFLPAAERYSLMSVIDRWVIQHTMARLAGWQPADGAPSLPLCCINLGGSSLADDALIGLIGQQLALHRLDASSLCFEIAEPAVLADLARAVSFTRGLRSLGCRVALDDFAGGLASLHHLKALSLDFLKLSASITRALGADALQEVVARAASEAAGVLGIPIIAKGADTPEIVAALRQVGVHYAQGFSLAPPRPIEDLITEAGASCPIP